MPVVTRSISRQLKRDRDIDEEEKEVNEQLQDLQPQKKKRKLNEKKSKASLQKTAIKKRQKRKNKKSESVDDEAKEIEISLEDLANDKENAPTKTKRNSKNKNSESDQDDLKEMNRLKEHHRKLLQSGHKCIVGVDEAGRGPLAGPVVVGAAYVPIDINIAGITDSKKINDEAEREKLYEIIINTKEIKWSVAILDHEIIDEFNILEASMIGMRRTVKTLHDEMISEGLNGIDYALCDGNRDPWKYADCVYPDGLKYEYITKGDGNVYCIGAASIIAKVTRDRIMAKYDAQYPGYGFLQHKGYPTPSHKELVWTKGPCPIHRKSFRPVSTWYKKNDTKTHKKWDDLKKERAEERKKKYAAKTKAGKKKKGQKDIKEFFVKKKSKKNKAKKQKKKKKKTAESEDQENAKKKVVKRKKNIEIEEVEQKDLESDIECD